MAIVISKNRNLEDFINNNEDLSNRCQTDVKIQTQRTEILRVRAISLEDKNKKAQSEKNHFEKPGSGKKEIER